MQQHELSKLELPDMPRPGQQPDDGLEFLVGERVVGQPHFDLLLQFAHPQQRKAFITEADDFLFLGSPRRMEFDRIDGVVENVRINGARGQSTITGVNVSETVPLP